MIFFKAPRRHTKVRKKSLARETKLKRDVPANRTRAYIKAVDIGQYVGRGGIYDEGIRTTLSVTLVRALLSTLLNLHEVLSNIIVTAVMQSTETAYKAWAKGEYVRESESLQGSWRQAQSS